MKTITINLQGADSAQLAMQRAKETRLIEFHNEVQRIITLEKRYWHAYDWVIELNIIPATLIAKSAIDFAETMIESDPQE